MRNQILFSLALAPLILVLGAPARAQQDKVTLKDGTERSGQIQEWDYRGIKLTIAGGGGTTTIRQNDIERVDFGAAPREFKTAEDEFTRERYEEAIANYAAVIEKKTNRSALRQEAYWKTALAQLSLNQVDAAVATLKAMVADGEFPGSHFIDRVVQRVADLLIATGKGADAVAYLEAEESRLSKLPESTALVDNVKFLKARSYLLAGDAKKAKTDATTLAGGSSPLAPAAKVLLGEIAVKDNNMAEAEKLFTDAMKVVSTSRDRAAAFNGLGLIMLEKGKASKKPEQVRDALEFFLRTALREYPEAGEPTDAHETGIFKAAECFQWLGEAGGDGKGPDDAQQRNLIRARDNYRRLVREYPQSKYAQEATSRLQKFGG